MLSQILKLFDYVILDVWGHLLGSDSLQMGFKSGVSTTHCSYLVMEVANHYLRMGTPTIATLMDCSKAFDMCLFNKLFQKLIDKKVPAIVVRVMIFMYEEQEGCVRLANVSSKSFKVTTGTKQGSVVSPTIFACYLDGLIQELRQLGLGCHVQGLWMGCAAFADDPVLLSPSRESMAKMLMVCEKYAAEHNLVFSTDPVPQKSKTKCLYIYVWEIWSCKISC